MADRKIHFVSLGCVKNRVDTEVMLGVAGRDGWRVVDEPDEAEVIVVNTCGFIGEAKKESIDTIFELAEYKSVGACKKLVVAGCLSQRYPDELAAQMPEVDHFLGSSDMLKLGDVLAGKADAHARRQPGRLGRPRERSARRHAVARQRLPEDRRGLQPHLLLLRHPAASRQAALAHAPTTSSREAERLVAAGAVELNLISQDTIAYGRDLTRADASRRRGSRREPARRARAPRRRRERASAGCASSTSIPRRSTTRSSSSSRTTRASSRTSTCRCSTRPTRCSSACGAGTARTASGASSSGCASRCPGLTFRTAFIVGHPGETEAEFDELCEFVTWARFEHVGVFRYSDEETCAAHALDGKVPPLVAANRARKLMALQRSIAREKNRALVGRELEVLVEGPSEEHELVMKGRHAGQAPEIDGSVYLSEGEAHAGEMRRVRIVQASD